MLLSISSVSDLDLCLGEMQCLYVLDKLSEISNNTDNAMGTIVPILSTWGKSLIKKSRDFHSFKEVLSPIDRREQLLKALNYKGDQITRCKIDGCSKMFQLPSRKENIRNIEKYKKQFKYNTAIRVSDGRMFIIIYKCAHTNKSVVTGSSNFEISRHNCASSSSSSIIYNNNSSENK